MFLFGRFQFWVPTHIPEVICPTYDPDILVGCYWYISYCKFGDLFIPEIGKIFLVISNIQGATYIFLHLRWCTYLKNKICTPVLRGRELFHVFMWIMNCFCGMVDWRKAFSLISSRDHCQRSSPSRISNTAQTDFEPAQNLRSGLSEWSCAVVGTTTSWRPNVPLLLMCTLYLVLSGRHVCAVCSDGNASEWTPCHTWFLWYS